MPFTEECIWAAPEVLKLSLARRTDLETVGVDFRSGRRPVVRIALRGQYGIVRMSVPRLPTDVRLVVKRGVSTATW